MIWLKRTTQTSGRLKRCLVFSAFFLMVAWMPFFSWAGDDASAPGVQVQERDEVVLYQFPAGTQFLTLAETPIHTAQHGLNALAEARLVHDVYIGERQVLSRASRFWGHVSKLEPPIEGRDAILEIRLHELELANGERLKLSAHIKTKQGTDWGGGLTKGTKTRKVLHKVYGVGAYAKLVETGPRAMGRHLKVDPGEYWRIVLDSPVVVAVPK